MTLEERYEKLLSELRGLLSELEPIQEYAETANRQDWWCITGLTGPLKECIAAVEKSWRRAVKVQYMRPREDRP